MKIAKDAVVTLEFEVYDEKDGKLLEATENDEPFSYIHGNGKFVNKIEQDLEGHEKGYETSIIVSPDEGYGQYDKSLCVELPREDFKDFEDLYVGMDFMADMDDGAEVDFIITEINDQNIKADGNHPFAGKTVRFEIKVANVRKASDQELEDGMPVSFETNEEDE